VKKRRWGQEKGEGSGGGSERRNDGLVDIPTYKPKTSHKIEEAAGDYVQPDQNDRGPVNYLGPRVSKHVSARPTIIK
jgi:hypothetical protein